MPRPRPRAGRSALLDAGATLTGKTITDELAYGLTGRNVHYGTPINAAARPTASPAARPAARPSAVSGRAGRPRARQRHRRLGAHPGQLLRHLRPAPDARPRSASPALRRRSAPSFDTCGWFARDAGLMERVGRVLLRAAETPPPPSKLLIGEDLFALADRDVAAAVKPAMDRAVRAIAKNETVKVFRGDPAPMARGLPAAAAREAWEADGAWIASTKPKLGPDVAERFEFASRVTDADLVGPRKLRDESPSNDRVARRAAPSCACRHRPCRRPSATHRSRRSATCACAPWRWPASPGSHGCRR